VSLSLVAKRILTFDKCIGQVKGVGIIEPCCHTILR
jgi:hypothetical protein